MISIKQLNRTRLKEFVYSEEFNRLKNIPISRHRALSHINNPRAKENDILLLLAYEGEEMVGYLGALPDAIWYDGQFEHCAWLSCIWVSPMHRGKKIALQLVNNCFDAWDNKILITEYTDPAKQLYLKTGDFSDLKDLPGLRLYLRAEFSRILPPKKKFYSQIKPLLSGIDRLINLVLDLRFLWTNKKLKHIQLEEINEIDEELEKFIEEKQENQLLKRGVKELNWIVSNPWILSGRPNYDSKRYHFSSIDRLFKYTPLKVRNKTGKLIGFILFSQRNCHLKVPYFYSDDTSAMASVINHLLIKWKVNTFTVYHEKLRNTLQNEKTIAFYSKTIHRAYMISNTFKIEKLGAQFEIQDGDGDCSFT